MKFKDNKYNIINKGFYNYSQNNDSVHVKQYIITKKDDKKCLVLRFLNLSNLWIKDLEIILTQMNSSGEIVDSSTVKLNKINAKPQDTFSANCGIVLNDSCVDFTVKVVGLSSGGYRYRESNGRMVPHYDPGISMKDKPKRYGKMEVYKCKPSQNILSAVVAIAVLIVFAVICITSSTSLFGEF